MLALLAHHSLSWRLFLDVFHSVWNNVCDKHKRLNITRHIINSVKELIFCNHLKPSGKILLVEGTSLMLTPAARQRDQTSQRPKPWSEHHGVRVGACVPRTTGADAEVSLSTAHVWDIQWNESDSEHYRNIHLFIFPSWWEPSYMMMRRNRRCLVQLSCAWLSRAEWRVHPVHRV